VAGFEDFYVTCNPTRSGDRQLAQFRLYNNGRRPSSVDSWFVAWNNYAIFSGEFFQDRSIFPIVLQEEERVDLLVDIHHRPVEDLAAG